MGIVFVSGFEAHAFWLSYFSMSIKNKFTLYFNIFCMMHTLISFNSFL
jgi:hypothetical protein